MGSRCSGELGETAACQLGLEALTGGESMG